MQILLIAMITVCCTALNLSSDEEQKFYDAEAYKTALEKVQDEVEVKIEQIKAQIKQIHQILDNVEITQTVRLVKLTESMADERDSLYQMQQILKVPFQLRHCKCAALDDETRAQVNVKIENIANSIANMKDSLRKCTFDKCPRYEELVLELNQQQNYLNIINETVNSECCDSPYVLEDEFPSGMIDLSGHLFKDNMKAEGWFYGTISKTDYILSRFELATKYNLTSCPIQTPYVNIFQNTCFNCSENEHFSLGTRKCYGCEKDQYFNTTQSKCTDCPPHQFFNYTLGECSHCPVHLVFDEQTKQCVACPKDSYPEFETSQCIKCEQYHYFSFEQKQCVTCNMDRGEYLNEQTMQCDICPNASFFSISQGKCISCPGESYYNGDSEKCVICPNNEHFLSDLLKCGTCQANYFYNPHVRKCIKCEQGLIFNDVIKACVADQAEVIGHEKCPSNYPYYNKYADKCEKCQLGQYFDFQDLTCKSKHYISICPPERPLYKQEVLSCQPCPSEIPEYDPYYHKCIACPETKPFYNNQTLICQKCQEGYSYNNEQKQCQGVQDSTSNDQSTTSPEKQENSSQTFHHLLMSEHENQARVSPIVYSSVRYDENYRYPYAQPIPSAKTETQVKPDSIDPTPISNQFVTQPVYEGPHQFPSPHSVSPTIHPIQSQPQKKFSNNRQGKDPRIVAQNQKVQINPSTITIVTLKPFSNTPNIDKQCQSMDEYMNYATKKCEQKSKICLRQEQYDFDNHKCVKKCYGTDQIYSYIAKQCQKCGQNEFYSQQKHSCLERKQGQVKCQPDQFYSQQKNKCLSDFQKCNSDQFLNTLTGQCERKSDSCTKHQFYNSGLHQCQHRSVLCLKNQSYDEETMLCLDNPNHS